MTIQLTKDTYVAGVLSAAGSQHTLDAQTESYLVHIGAATWVETAYTQGRFEDAKIEYDSDGVATGIVGRANEVVGPVWAKDASGNVTGLVGQDGVHHPVSVAAALDEGNTAAQNKAEIESAILRLYAKSNGGAGEITFPDGEFSVEGPILVTGQYPQESISWLGGITFKGGGVEATRLVFTTAAGFQIDPYGVAGSTTMIDFADMQIIGPGKSTAGSVGIDYGSQTANAVVSSRIRLESVFIKSFEVCLRCDDVTSLMMERCVFQDYVYAHSFGYNVDIIIADLCNYGSSITPLGSQSETALHYNYRSLVHPSGGLSNNAHVFRGCWFMRQLIAADIYDTAASNIKFDSCYYESTVQYAKIGQSGTSNSPPIVVWDNCHFSIPYYAGETAAKIEVQNTAAISFIGLYNCRTDSTNGPNGGWVNAGSGPGCIVSMDGCIMPTGGSATTQAHIRYGTKNIVAPNYSPYLFRSHTSSGRRQEQFNGGSSNPNRETWAFGGTSSTVFERWAVKATASESEGTGSYPRIIDQVNGGAHYVMFDGYSRPTQSSALPTAIAELRGCTYIVQGGAGVADAAYICLKGAADTYSWVSIATG